MYPICVLGAHEQPGGLWSRATPRPCSPVGVEDSFHLGDVGLERDGTEFVQLLVVEQQVLVPETNGCRGLRTGTGAARSALGSSPALFLWKGGI